MELLKIENLSFTYAGADTPALQRISLKLDAGEFALLTGETGCGKSTLLRLIKRELAPRGNRSGCIFLQGRETDTLTPRDAAAKIGFVFQRPEEQIVTDRVWHELAFGLENLGIPEQEMRRRVAEAAQFFGLEDSFDQSPELLSGGRRQLLNLAAATAMEPELLLLDEPTARLDPIAAKNFLAALERLNRETGMTILMAEHRLEDSLSRADRLIWMEKGKIQGAEAPREACARISTGSPLEGALPAAARLWRESGREGKCPLNTGEGRSWAAARLPDRLSGASAAPGPKKTTDESPESPALSFREVWFRFDRNGPDILRSLNLQVMNGEIVAILGGNGSGKTTLLRAAAGLISPYSGEIRFRGKRLREYRSGTFHHQGAAMLPQDVQTLFLRGSVREELKDAGITPEKLPFDLSSLLDQHPYDLSGGEQQLLGLARVLAGDPRLLLLDEPTSGLDAGWRSRIQELLKTLRNRGMTILLATHDAEFAATVADRCGLLFRGRMEALEDPHAFFQGGSYYTTPASRMVPGCITVAEAAKTLAKGGCG